MPGVQSGSSVWYGSEIANKESDWLFTFTELELIELLIVANKLVASSKENLLSLEYLEEMDLNVELPRITARTKDFTDKLHNGLGFFVWRGIPVTEWSRKQTAGAFLIIGKCLGNLRQQNSKGHVLGKTSSQIFQISIF